jgi:hypothetical protein
VAMSPRPATALAGVMNSSTVTTPTSLTFAPPRSAAFAALRHIGTVRLDARHNGPRHSANGGLAAGSFAEVTGSPARVVLRAPVPLRAPLDITRTGNGAYAVRRRSRLIAEVTRLERGSIAPAPPVLPTIEQAFAASLAAPGLDRGHPLAHCWVCSRYRADGLGVAPGILHDHPGVLAARFLAPGAGWVPESHIWAALDCPSYPAQALHDGRVFVLGTQSVEIHRPVPAGANYAVVGWTVAGTARTFRTASVLLDSGGEVIASSEAIWVQLRGRGDRARALVSTLRGALALESRPTAFRPERLSLS